MGKRPQEYFVRCASGFEDILIRELKGIGTGQVLCPCEECVRNAVLALEAL